MLVVAPVDKAHYRSLDAILRAAAAAEPEERLSSAELARRLSQVARELPRPASLPGSPSPKAWRPYDDMNDLGTNPAGPANGSKVAPHGATPDASSDAYGDSANEDTSHGTGAYGNAQGNGSVVGTNGSATDTGAMDPNEISGGTDAMALAEAIGIAEAASAARSADKTAAPSPEAWRGDGPAHPDRPARHAPGGPNGRARSDDLTEIGAPGMGAPVAPPARREPGAPGQPFAPDKTDRGASDETELGFTNGYGPSAREVFEKRRHRRWPWIVGLVVIVLAGLGAGGLIAQNRYHVFVQPKYKIPSLQGMTEAEATRAVAKDRFHVRVTGRTYNITAKTGTILTQTPAKGRLLVKGGTISVVTSAGPPPVRVPNLAAVTGGCQNVTSVLGAVHLAASCTTTTSLTVKAGSVISYSPNTSATYGTTVKVVVSTGLPMVPVPDLAGLSKTQATTTLEGDHFRVAYGASQYSSTIADGEVLPGWTGEGQSLTYGSTVTIAISLGHAPVQVPNVDSGRYDVAQAESALRTAGLTIQGVFGPTGANRVVDTDPAGGVTVPYGTPVSIYTGYGA